MENSFYADEAQAPQTGVRDVFDKYLAYWKWFLAGILLSLALSYAYVRYSLPLYEVKASVLIRDDEKGAALSELSAFGDLNLLEGKSNIDNEIEVVRSRRLMAMVAERLALNIQYFLEEGPVEKERYHRKPLKMSFIDGDSSMYHVKADFTVSVLSGSEFELLDAHGNSLGNRKFGELIRMPFGRFILTPVAASGRGLIGKDVRVRIVPMEQVVSYYAQQLKIEAVNTNANVIGLRLTDASREKAEAIVNTLIDVYNADAVSDKNQVASNTAHFINERIDFITRELSDVELSAEQFKTKNQLVDVVSEAGMFLDNGSQNNRELLTAGTQLQLVDYLYDHIRAEQSPGGLVPANLGIADASVGELTDTYNKLALERNRLLKSSSEKNPVIVSLDEQLYSLHRNLKESLNNLKISMTMKVRALQNQERLINSKIASVPKYEREYRLIERQQQIKESLYLYLLQKREETAISLAVTVANAKVIDRAYSDGNVVFPKKKIVYAIGGLGGLLLVVLIIYLKELLDNKVKGRKALEHLNIPYVGDIPLTDDKEKLVIRANDNSPVSEAFRLVKTNLSFMAGTAGTSGKTIFVTSTISKEGKSFIALNLAATYAFSGKKVLLLGMDLRAPKLQEYLGMQPQFGVTNYITDPALTIDDLVIRLPGYENLHIIASGPIPPNPAELLASQRISELFATVKERFDLVIVDTAPIGLIADTLLITDYADLFVYVVRNNFLDKRMLKIPEQLFREKRIPNMALLLNSVDEKRDLGYGYGYGYGYGAEKPVSRWNIFRKK